MAAEAEGKEAMAGTTAETAAAANMQTAAVWVMTQMVMPQMAAMPETKGGRLKTALRNPVINMVKATADRVSGDTTIRLQKERITSIR
jgi:hypothetical protein